MRIALIGALYISALLAAATILLKLFEWLSKRRTTAAELQSLRDSFDRRLRLPDWSFYESHLQRAVPKALRDMFSEKNFSATILQFGMTDFFLTPIDAQALDENWVSPDTLPFAHSEADPIYLKPGANETNEVMITYHDGSETGELSSTIEEFAANIVVVGKATAD